MQSFIQSSFTIGSLVLTNRLIQGPLAGFSCSPFRKLFYQFSAPAYCVSEMISAQDLIQKTYSNSRYLHRAAEEKNLCYQISGTSPLVMAKAAELLQDFGANLLDINCGCPKTKIRKKGAGSALLDHPELLLEIVSAVRKALEIPLTVKLRIQGNENDFQLAKNLESAGVNALIIHGRRWTDDYLIPNDLSQIAKIKAHLSIPVIANGDIAKQLSLEKALEQTGCDAFMIARAGTGKPWLYQNLFNGRNFKPSVNEQIALFMQHLDGLAHLENEHKALLQSRKLIRYYFREQLATSDLEHFYKIEKLAKMTAWLNSRL